MLQDTRVYLRRLVSDLRSPADEVEVIDESDAGIEHDDGRDDGDDGEMTVAERIEAGATPAKRNVLLETGLTAEEYVREIVEHNDGCVPQCDIVRTTDWSKSSVSRLLSSMEEDGSVRRFPMGARKIVCVPGEEPEWATDSRPEARGD